MSYTNYNNVLLTNRLKIINLQNNHACYIMSYSNYNHVLLFNRLKSRGGPVGGPS